MKTRILGLVKVQFIMTVLAFLLAPQILSFLGFRHQELDTIFRTCLLASFFQVLLLIMTVLFWYLELLNESFLCVSMFAVLNTVVNYFLMFYTNATPGIGWLIAGAASCAVAGALLIIRVRHLNYIVFVHNPILESQKLMPKFD